MLGRNVAIIDETRNFSFIPIAHHESYSTRNLWLPSKLKTQRGDQNSSQRSRGEKGRREMETKQGPLDQYVETREQVLS